MPSIVLFFRRKCVQIRASHLFYLKLTIKNNLPFLSYFHLGVVAGILIMAPKIEEYLTLPNGIKMPRVALGTWKVSTVWTINDVFGYHQIHCI